VKERERTEKIKVDADSIKLPPQPPLAKETGAHSADEKSKMIGVCLKVQSEGNFSLIIVAQGAKDLM